VIQSFYGNLMKKYDIDHRRSIKGHLYIIGGLIEKGIRKNYGSFWLHLNNYHTDYYDVDSY